MLIQPEKRIQLAKPYQIQLTNRTIIIECSIEVAADLDDEWITPEPAYSIGQIVWIITPSLPHTDWEQKRIFGIELYAPRWEHGSLITEPVWYFGVKGLRGRGDICWLSEDKITQTPQHYDFESDWF